VAPERIAEAQGVVKAIKAEPSKLASAAEACTERAFRDGGFSQWLSFASTEYEQKLIR
jgi:hypothetical protein